MKIFFIVVIGVLFFACSENKRSGELLEIPVDSWPEVALPLSEIVEEITAIELEVTDQSLMTPRSIRRIVLCEDKVIVAEWEKILVFNRDGKFLRSIGSKGQGPGEFISIRNIALDEKNKRLFVNNLGIKVICYDLDGNFLKESSLKKQNGMDVVDLNYVNGELLILGEHLGRKEETGKCNRSSLYRLNDELQIIDSCIFRDVCFESTVLFTHVFENFIQYGNSSVQLYYSDIYFDMQNPAETVLRDTLFTMKKNRLVPELKLKFKNEGLVSGRKHIHLFNIYRSSRYIFAFYNNDLDNNYYHFYYDTKTGKGYRTKDGFTDDIHQIEDKVKIRPLALDTEYFYYWHTHINDDDIEEPNPTLYIAKLKK